MQHHHTSGSEGCQFGFFEPHEFSNNTSERLESSLHQGIRHYKGKRFVLVAKKSIV